MVAVHNTVGTLVVLAYLVLAVLYGLWAVGRPLPATRVVSGIAAGLLLLQYALGFWLLGNGNQQEAIHYIIALLAIGAVGIEHGYARTRPTPRAQAATGAGAAALAFGLVLVAYAIGMS